MEAKISLKEIINSIQEDITAGRSVSISEQGDDCVSVFDEEDIISREYTIYDPDLIDAEWIRDRILVTPSAAECMKIDLQALSGWLYETLDREVFLTLQNIVFCNDTEKDFDFLHSLDSDLSIYVESSDLPDVENPKSSIGILWFEAQAVFVNIGSIIKLVREDIDNGYLDDWEEDVGVNREMCKTLVHELRHLEQSNPYIPEDILMQMPDEEADAENYASEKCDFGLPLLLDIGSDVKEME